MSDQPENLALVYLRRIDAKLDKLQTDIPEIKERLGFLEGTYASVSRRVDRMDDRLERIERRLDLVDMTT